MDFIDFCRAHGLKVDGIRSTGRWVRVPTVDKPRSDNGAYKYLGDVGFVQNWATMSEPATWKPEAHEVKPAEVARIRAEAERVAARQKAGWAKAADRAKIIIGAATPGEHDYLHRKGLGEYQGLVADDGALVVPMRHWRTNALMGAQLIRWDMNARAWDKRMLPGMRARGAVYRIGSPVAARSWLVEGYATGLSVAAALRLMRWSDAVIVCFSAGNLVTVASELGGRLVAFADNDESQAGEMAARHAGIPYVMSPVIGEDANDMHKRLGVFQLAQHMRAVGVG